MAREFRRQLTAFEPPGAQLSVEVSWEVALPVARDGARTWRVQFVVVDPAEVVVWPAPSMHAGERDGLWQHTCLELFIGLDRADNYGEVNVSPSGDWAFYYFDTYRNRQNHVGPTPVPSGIRVERVPTRRIVGFELDVGRLHDLIGHPPWRAQPTAVLETKSGLTYWAPSHPSVRPDFHRFDGCQLWDPYDCD